MPGTTLKPDLGKSLSNLAQRLERLERRTSPVPPGVVQNTFLTDRYTYGESLNAGHIVYIRSDGFVAKASAAAGGNFPAFGLALETASAGDSHEVLLFGEFQHSTFSLTIGQVIWLSTTAGAITQTQPSGTDQGIQPLGWATETDTIFFRPDITWLTHV